MSSYTEASQQEINAVKTDCLEALNEIQSSLGLNSDDAFKFWVMARIVKIEKRLTTIGA